VVAFGLDLASFVVGLHWGVNGVAGAYALMNTVVIVPLTLCIVTRLLECPLRLLFARLRGILEATLVMTVLTFSLRQLLELAGAGAALRLVLVIAAGVASYALMCRWRDPRIFADLRPRPVRVAAT
jgi:hypothetical protein